MKKPKQEQTRIVKSNVTIRPPTTVEAESPYKIKRRRERRRAAYKAGESKWTR